MNNNKENNMNNNHNQKENDMKTFIVKFTGSNEWTEIQAASKIELAERLRQEGKSGTIKSLQNTQEETVNKPKVHNKHKNTAPVDAVYIGRGSKWGNPFVIDKDGSRSDVIAKYEEYILGKPELLAQLHELKGKDLVCYCAPQACHGDILVRLANNPEEGTMDTNPTPTIPTSALIKLEKLTPEEIAEITALLEKNVLPHLQSDVSNYAKGRQRVWLPYEAPLGNQPFTTGLMDDEVWQWIVDRCAKHGFKAQVALISKGGNIKPHRDTTYAAAWAIGFNLGKCDWHIASTRDSAKTDFTMNLVGGEVFKFNSKHTHAVTNAESDRWSINVWAIATGPAADNANISGRLDKMLEEHPEVQEFIDLHQPGATTTKSKEDTIMATKPKYHIAFTGHRPQKLGGFDPTNPKRAAVRTAIHDALQRAIDKYGKTHEIVVISGGALGVDQDAASIANKLGLPFIVAVPCQGHDSKWNPSDKARYKTMLSHASQVVMVHDGPYNNTCMQDRNEWMVDHCDALVAVWDGSSGGTANCVKYAQKMKKPIIFINPDNLNGGGGTPKPTPNNPEEGPAMKNEASFKGTFLSNFWPANVMHGGIVFPTVENFYQAMKVDKTDINTRRQFQSISAVEAKKKGKEIEKRKDWNDAMALDVMLYGLRAKFAKGSELAEKLLATEDQELIETNYWHDTFWGKCTCANHAGNGENKLGILLMQVREELKNNGGGGTPEPTPNNPEEGPKMKAEQPQNNNPVTETNNGKETKMSSKPISVDKWTTDMGLSVELKRSDGDYQKEAGRSWFAVVQGKVSYPKKDDGVIDELTARIWLSRNGLCAMPEIKTPEVKPTEKKEETMKVMNNPLIGTVTLPNGITLNLEQSQAYEAIVNGTGNMLLTGNAGTGKSFVLNQAIETMKQHGRSIVVTATTGIAATHINGKTYHSALRMFPNKSVDELVGIMSNQRFIRGMRSVELIVIDEISMMHKNDFVKLDLAFRQIFDSTKPFGGKRFCFVGDFLQIEPVDKENKAQTNFVFMTETWKNAGVVTYQLKQVVRQQDALFAGFLNNVRQGIWTSDMQPIVDAAMSKPKPKSGVVSLVPTNREADSINQRQMAALDTQEFVFEAFDRNPNKFDPVAGAWVEDKAYWDKNVLVEKTLKLKVGAQVICLLNHDGLVNGDTGVVEQIDDTAQAVQVNFNRVGLKWVVPEKFHQGQEEIEFRLQIPLKTAWAITIHKSQGMTLDSAIISAGAIFTDGQCYVCLSRVRSMDGLYLESFSPDIVSASDKALEFYGLPGNLRGPAAELHSNMPKGDDDPDGNGGVFPVDPTPNNNDGDDNAAVPTHEEEIMDEEVWEPKDPENFDFEDEEEEKEQVMEVTEPIKEQNFAKVDKSADATNKTPKEGNNMIKEYLVETVIRGNDRNPTHLRSIGRVITNDPDYWFKEDSTVVIEQVDRGGYHYALLEHVFGNQSFIVNITGYKNPLDGEAQVTHVQFNNVPLDTIFGWADFDSETILRVKDHGKKGWSNLSEFGLAVKNSDKMTKRLAELVRAARGYKINVKSNGDKFLRILVLTHKQILKALPHLRTEFAAEKSFDGISIMAVEKAKDVYSNNVYMSKHAKRKMLKQMDEMEITNHTLRVLTNIDGVAGEIKGNVLTTKRAMLNARLVELGLSDGSVSYDIVTSVDNFKKELGTDGTWEIITLEPHHGPGMVKTNDQTLAQFFGIKGIFHPKEILDAFQTVLDDMKGNIFEGKDIEWTTMLRNERAVTEADKFNQARANNNVGLNKMYATLNDLELPLGVSQTLMYMRANSIKKMFLSDTRVDEYGTQRPNWTAPAKEKKSFLYMPWAYRAYVMTKEVIFMAGYDIDMENTNCGYHKETQTFAMPGKQWAETCGKLGGADLDDEIMVHIRKIVELDGSERLAALLIRTPNDWAEFDIVDVKVPGPVFVNSLDMPTINMKDLVKFHRTSINGQLPSKVNGSNRPKPAVWDWASTCYNFKVAMHKNGGVGNQVKTKMLQYTINNAPFATLPCANEDMIDAIQQCKGDIDDLKELAKWSTSQVASLLRGKPMDAYWWYSRNMYGTSKALKIDNPTKHLEASKSPIVSKLMVPREEMINEAFAEIFEFLKSAIVEIEEIDSIFDNKKQEMHFRKLITDVMKTFYIPRGTNKAGRNSILDKAATGIMARVVEFEKKNGVEATNMHILRMARASYLLKVDRKGANHDKWLYTVTPNSDTLMTDYLFRAMVWYRENKI